MVGWTQSFHLNMSVIMVTIIIEIYPSLPTMTYSSKIPFLLANISHAIIIQKIIQISHIHVHKSKQLNSYSIFLS